MKLSFSLANLPSKISTLALSAFIFLATASPAFAQTSVWSGVCISAKNPDVATLQGFQCLIANVLAVFLTVVGIGGFLTLVIAAFRILISGSDSQALDKSKKAITAAIIGLIIALSAFVILNLVAQFTGVETILEFKIPDSETIWK